MNPFRFHLPAFHALAFAALLGAGAGNAAATTYTWLGTSGNNSWTTDTNWQGGTAPPSNLVNTDLIFANSGGPYPSINTPYSIHSLTFTANANAFIFDTGPLTLGAGGFTQNAANAETFGAAVILGAAQTWTLASGAGALTFGNGVNTGSSSTPYALTINAATTTGGGNIVNATIAGSGSLTKTGAGTLTLTGASTYSGGTTVSAGNLAVASGGSLSGTAVSVQAGATLAFSGTGSLTASSSSLSVDGSSMVAANLSIADNATVSSGMLIVGSLGVGVATQPGGTFTTNGKALLIAFSTRANSGTGTYNLSGGSLSTGEADIGSNATGTFNQTGGTFTTNGDGVYVGNSGGIGTYNLGGGTLTTGIVAGELGTGRFNFNGGMLQANRSSTDFFEVTTANVQTGGARIDTQSYSVTIAQNLLHDTTSGAPALDGGLTKLGTGTLTLTGTNSFTGPLTISAGTLAVASESNLGAGSTVNVASGGQLLFTSSAQLARTYNLGVSTLGISSGQSLTFANVKVNGGFLAGPGMDILTEGTVLNNTRVATGTALNQTGGQAAFNNVVLSGTCTYTQAAGAVLNLTGDFIATAPTTLTVNGTVNAAGGSISGGLTINNGAVFSTAGGSAAPLYLDGSRGTTVSAGGMLSAANGSTVELGGLLTNNGQQTGTLHVNLGGVVRGMGIFGSVSLAANSTFQAAGTITGSLSVGSGATVNLSGSGQALVVNGTLTNNGIMRFDRGASLSVTSGAANLVNNGTIDIITGSANLPVGFTNNGLVLDSSVTRVKTIARAGNGSSVTFQIDAYPGHSYKLQRSNSLASGSFADVPNVPAQSNAATSTAAMTLTFTDAAPAAAAGFYRVQVDS